MKSESLVASVIVVRDRFAKRASPTAERLELRRPPSSRGLVSPLHIHSHKQSVPAHALVSSQTIESDHPDIAVPFGQVVIGPPGSGKSTYCYGLHQVRLRPHPSPRLPPLLTSPLLPQFYTALGRPILIVNLDPAAPTPSYPCALSISSLISLSDAMDAHALGPNGAMLYCLEYLEANLDWLEGELDRVLEEGGWGRESGRREEPMVVFDTPGQVELSTDHGSLKRILEHLGTKGGWRVSLPYPRYEAEQRKGRGGAATHADEAGS